jgi:primosomal protein N' (replication factor Y)
MVKYLIMTGRNKYARVVVGIPIDNIFDYLIPHSLMESLKIGMRVLVPFGKRRLVGYVVGFTDKAEVKDIKEIREVLDDEPTLSDSLLKLTKWIASYYFSSWGMAIKTALLSSFNKGVKQSKGQRFKGEGIEKPEISHQSKARLNTLRHEQYDSYLRIIKESLEKGGHRTFLLHCISGRIEVYIQAIAQSLLLQVGAIVLVPEISLTSELIMRFRYKFGSTVAVLHSGLTETERLHEWRRIQKGEAAIVIGVRSAVFAPFKRLGLIIIDEEQDPSYKQDDGLRYNARDVAIMRGKVEGATVILGSATPSLESFYNAEKGKYHYLSLPEGIAPSISLIDMSKEKKGIISERLRQGISERLERGEKVLLLLNRRGYSPFLLCRECGYTPRCPNCSITITYHKVMRKGRESVGPILNCHYCNYSTSPPSTCPDCGGINIGYIGAGTERVEEELKRLYPEASLARIDRDITGRGKIGLEGIINRDADIIFGTQLIAKGDSGSPVTLAGVLWADRGLHIPDFRSGERTFQLMAQLAGRVRTGELIIQTHNPDHYSLRHAKDYDYKRFYKDEMRLRREIKYPPFYRLVRILLKGNEEGLLRIIPDLKGIIKGLGPDRNIEILGPAPAPLYKLKGKFRWHLIIKGKSLSSLRDYTARLIQALKERRFPGIKIEVDMDPVRMV